MKKTLLSLIAFLCCITMATNAQIPNSGFENWTGGDPDNWATSNSFPVSLINITQTTDSHSGSYAVRGDVINFLSAPAVPIIQSGPDATGFVISEQYHSFELYYKFTSVGGDKFSVNVALEKAGNPIAQGAVALPSTMSTYTYLSVPLTYTTIDIPDLAIIQISISGPVTGLDVHLGSVMFVDDLSFSFSTGIKNSSASDLIGKCFPNPSSDIVSIPLNESVSEGIIVYVFDSYGKEVKKMSGYQQQDGKNGFQFSVEDLSSLPQRFRCPNHCRHRSFPIQHWHSNLF